MSQKGHGNTNEDVYGNNDQFAWVIDGATDVFNKNALEIKNEVSWYVNNLSKRIFINSSKDNNLESILMKSIQDVLFEIPKLTSINVKEYELPTFAIAFTKWTGSYLEYLILGDCCICVFENNSPKIITDNRISKFAKLNRKKLKQHIENIGMFPNNKSIFQKTRMKANDPDGYPIGSMFGTGVPLAKKGQIKLKNNSRVLLFSDGLLDYVETYPDRITCFFDNSSFDNEIERLYKFLNDNTQYVNNPRPKKVDDCTILLLEMKT